MDCIVIAGIFLVTGMLLSNINYYSFPSGDFIPYVDEGRAFVSGSLPPLLNNAPIYSVAIVLLGKLIPYQYPELIAGIILNIALFAIGIWMVWKIAEQWFGRVGLVVFCYLLLHPLSYHVVLNPLNIVAFSTAFLTTIYLRMKGRSAAAYALAGISYWIRPEAVALLLAMGAIDLIRNVQKKQTLKYLILASLPMILWEISVAFHNEGGNIYAAESLALRSEIPNGYFLNFTFSNLIVTEQFLQNPWLLGALLAYIIAGVVFFILDKNREKQLLSLYTLVYFAIHLFFPGKGDRYTFPLLMPAAVLSVWPLELSLKLNKKIQKKLGMGIRLLFILFSIGVVLNNKTQIQPFLSARKEYRGEYRMIADWITQQLFQRPTVIVTFNPGGVQYFTNNNSVEIFRIEDHIDQCDTITCVIFNNWQYFNNKDILLIYDSFTQKSDTIYDNRHGVKLFKNMEHSQDKKYFRFMQMLESEDRWVKIYRFNISSS